MTKELAVKETATIDIGTVLTKALEHGTSTENLERLLNLSQQIKAEAAKDAFFDAMTQFQKTCPAIKRTKQVSGSIRYNYAPIEDITEVVRPLLTKLGFSYRFEPDFETENNKDYVIVTCVISHIGGHSERSSMRCPVDYNGRMNSAQATASAMTYAKRYSLCNALGINPDEDDDALNAGGNPQNATAIVNVTPGQTLAQAPNWQSTVKVAQPVINISPPVISQPPAPKISLDVEQQEVMEKFSKFKASCEMTRQIIGDSDYAKLLIENNIDLDQVDPKDVDAQTAIWRVLKAAEYVVRERMGK